MGEYSYGSPTDDFVLIGGSAYCASGNSGLSVIDPSNPKLPGSLGHAYLDGYASTINMVDTAAFVACSADGLQIVEITNPDPGLPVIVEGPMDQYAVPGTEITLSVVVSGSPPFFYQWQHEEVDIPGATNATHSLIAATDAVGAYRVVVSNHVGSATSSVAQLLLMLPELDLSLGMVVEPAWATISSNVIYTLTVTNHGPSDASQVELEYALPANLQLVGITLSQGSQVTNTSGLVFELGALSADGAAIITIEGTCVGPGPSGRMAANASVTAQTYDPNDSNNQVLTEIEVILPPLPIASRPAADQPPGTLSVVIPIVPGFNTVIQYTDALGPAVGWSLLPGIPQGSEVVTLTVETATRFYRVLLIPR